MRQYDIEFLVNSGDKEGNRYGFTLAKSNGRKMWNVQRLFQPPPAMAKERIEMGIAVRAKNISRSGANELELANHIINQLETIADETTPATLTGLDGIKRAVLIDRQGFTIEPTVSEMKQDPEFQVTVLCWSVYE